jgi:caspase domain-containing protein
MTRPVRALLIAGDDIGRPGTPAPGTVPAQIIVDLDLRERFRNPEITRLQSGPTRQQVLSAFAAVQGRLLRGDLFVVMFAGHGDAPTLPGSGQLWHLTDGQSFNDNELADQLLKLPGGVDIVVISDCCYGAGFFTRGPGLPPANADRGGAPHGLTLTDAERKVLTTQSRALGSVLFAELGAEDSPMVCISAASKDQEVSLVELPHLTRWTAVAADRRETYGMLKAAFEADAPAGAAFHVDARPPERFGERVLGV